jgi:phosphate transport system permease protein
MLVPIIVAGCLLAVTVGDMIEADYLGVPASVWVEQHWGLDYSQRNALVVGIAMGLAVIPSIFSIAEDAVFSVPRHLSDGSLALGASRWQTLRNVVLPAASPGIFSALVIGLGRAVGETMIVLMATGNTPLMEANLFSGMRTLSANIAVEIPEVAAGSTHYRVLIVSALLLFLLTFVLNSLAELLRQRLRRQYGAL